MYFFVFNSFFYEPPNIHNLALVGLYSMMSAFLLSLNFNIWQFATKHICYSNIYTTYIAIYVTSQQRMVFPKKKKQTTTKQSGTKKKEKKRRAIPTWSVGRRKLSQNLARKICTRIYSRRDVTVQLKKKGFRHFSNYWGRGTHCLLLQVFFSSFFCKMAYRRISWNEVVHTSVHEIYTVTLGGIQDFSEEGKLITKTPPKTKEKQFAFFFF